MEDVAGKSYIITGAGGGMGRETALTLGRFGAQVATADVNGVAAKATADEIEASGGTAIGLGTDVSDEGQVKDMVAATVSAFGGLDGAANCAGISSHLKPVDQLTLAEWDRVVAINLTGAFLCVKYQAAAMVAGGRPGSIIVISSAAASKAYPALCEYAAAKAGLGGLVRGAAADLGPHDIRVNAILPGRVDTAMHRNFSSGASSSEDQAASQQLLPRVGQPAELADAIIWLLSDRSSFVTGVELPVDGGLTVG